VRLKILGIHRQRLFQCMDGLLIPALEKQDAPGLIQRDAIARVLIFDLCQALERAVVIAVCFLDHGAEEVCARELGTELQRSIRKGSRRIGFAFLDQNACDVDPTVGVFRFDLGHAKERVFGALQVALQ